MYSKVNFSIWFVIYIEIKQKSNWYPISTKATVLFVCSTSTEKATVVMKVIPSLIEFCKVRGDTLLQDHLERQSEQEPVGRMLLYQKYRRTYVDQYEQNVHLMQLLNRLQRNLN